MKPNLIFSGSIRKIESCTLQTTAAANLLGFGCGIIHPKVETSPYKDDAILIKVAESGYVDIDSIKSIFDLFKIRKLVKNNKSFVLGGIVLSETIPLISKKGDLYVDKKQQFEEVQNMEDISVWQLKKIRKNKQNSINNK